MERLSKRATTIAILVLIGLIALGSYVIIYSIRLDHSTPFNAERVVRATALYDRVMLIGSDLIPDNPMSLMELKNSTMMLLYGQYIYDRELFEDVIKQQRLLLSEEILDLNSFESQYNHFLSYVEDLQRESARLVNIDIVGISHLRSDFYRAVARVVHNYTAIGSVNFVYYLRYYDEDDLWRIQSWFIADENFEIEG